MTVFAIAILLGAAVVVAVLSSWRRRIDVTELGAMSANWIAEHHANGRHYSER
jgi:hypothetical protein